MLMASGGAKSDVDVSIAAPLFLLALLIARRRYRATADAFSGKGVPALQTSYDFAHKSPLAKRSPTGARRTVLLAVDLLCRLFIASSVSIPVVHFPVTEVPPSLSKKHKWLSLLNPDRAEFDNLSDLCRLREELQGVEPQILNDVCVTYNKGIARAKAMGMRLPAGPAQLDASCLLDALMSSLPVPDPVVPIAVPTTVEPCKGTFYYIAAGVGCGVRQLQEVQLQS